MKTTLQTKLATLAHPTCHKRKPLKTVRLGYGFSFDTRNGCLSHPGGHLTSWFRWDTGLQGWKVTEWATYLSPDVSGAICNALQSPLVLTGAIKLPLRPRAATLATA